MSQTLQTRIHMDRDILLKVLKSVDSLDLSEAVFTITSEGLSFRAMDSSHVALVDISLPNSCFEIYDISDDILLTFRVKELLDIVKSLDKKGTVKINLDSLDLTKISQNGCEFTVERLENNISTDIPLPKIPYDTSIQFADSLGFKKLLLKIKSVSDYVTINSSDYKISLSGKGDNGSVNMTIEKDDLTTLNINQESETTYSLEYLIPFLRVCDKDTVLSFQYSTAKPCRMEILINKIGRIHFYLAPRVEC